jgi:ABC-2 type transport system permease protein
VSAILTIAKREVFAFFVSPIAYVVLTVWLIIFGVEFYMLAFVFGQQPGADSNLLTAFFGGTALFYVPLLFFGPVLTMRLLAEERSSGTIEALLTAPVSEVSVVLGKYLAALTFWVVLWAPTFSYVWIVSRSGEHTVDWGAIGATYLGLFCIGVFYMAIGLFMSAVARNQIVAAMLTFLALGGLFIVGILGFLNVSDDIRGVFEYLGLWTQMSAFAKGIVDTRYLVFDASMAVIALFFSVRVLQSNRGMP